MAEVFVCNEKLTMGRARVDWRGREHPVTIRRGEHVAMTDRTDTGVTVHCLGGTIRMPKGT